MPATTPPGPSSDRDGGVAADGRVIAIIVLSIVVVALIAAVLVLGVIVSTSRSRRPDADGERRRREELGATTDDEGDAKSAPRPASVSTTKGVNHTRANSATSLETPAAAGAAGSFASDGQTAVLLPVPAALPALNEPPRVLVTTNAGASDGHMTSMMHLAAPGPATLRGSSGAAGQWSASMDVPPSVMADTYHAAAAVMRVQQQQAYRALQITRQVQLGQYQRGAQMGQGAQGSVYRCVLNDGGLVALKVIPDAVKSPEEGEQLVYELRLMARLRSRFLVRCFHTTYSPEANEVTLFLEHCHSSLTALVRNHGAPMSEHIIRRYMQSVVRAVAVLHHHGVVHRDIKGENVLLDTDGNVKLSDFGTAKKIVLGDEGVVRGTPLWMPPEILNPDGTDDDAAAEGAAADLCAGGQQRGTKVDIWALGITVAELLNQGQTPWPQFHDVWDLIRYIGEGKPPLFPLRASAHCMHFMQLCCSRDPRKRPSAAQLLEHPWLTSDVEYQQEAAAAAAMVASMHNVHSSAAQTPAAGAGLAAGGHRGHHGGQSMSTSLDQSGVHALAAAAAAGAPTGPLSGSAGPIQPPLPDSRNVSAAQEDADPAAKLLAPFSPIGRPPSARSASDAAAGRAAAYRARTTSRSASQYSDFSGRVVSPPGAVEDSSDSDAYEGEEGEEEWAEEAETTDDDAPPEYEPPSRETSLHPHLLQTAAAAGPTGAAARPGAAPVWWDLPSEARGTGHDQFDSAVDNVVQAIEARLRAPGSDGAAPGAAAAAPGPPQVAAAGAAAANGSVQPAATPSTTALTAAPAAGMGVVDALSTMVESVNAGHLHEHAVGVFARPGLGLGAAVVHCDDDDDSDEEVSDGGSTDSGGMLPQRPPTVPRAAVSAGGPARAREAHARRSTVHAHPSTEPPTAGPHGVPAARRRRNTVRGHRKRGAGSDTLQ